ncbi:TetR/AcrR family transcriptional regulator [Wenyingzhuangia sp. IMCC45533]
MKDKILERATEMFLNIGFKSVTMDDISNELGISKKTIYTHFKNKNKLVEESSFQIFHKLCDGINSICANKLNSISELFEIKSYVMKNLKNEKSSPQYQLQKFFPDIHLKMKKKHFEIMRGCVDDNIERGIKEGLFRKNINPDFITRIYFSGMHNIKDEEIFPAENFGRNELTTTYLDYHIRAIATTKGIQILEQTLQNDK